MKSAGVEQNAYFFLYRMLIYLPQHLFYNHVIEAVYDGYTKLGFSKAKLKKTKIQIRYLAPSRVAILQVIARFNLVLPLCERLLKKAPNFFSLACENVFQAKYWEHHDNKLKGRNNHFFYYDNCSGPDRLKVWSNLLLPLFIICKFAESKDEIILNFGVEICENDDDALCLKILKQHTILEAGFLSADALGSMDDTKRVKFCEAPTMLTVGGIDNPFSLVDFLSLLFTDKDPSGLGRKLPSMLYQRLDEFTEKRMNKSPGKRTWFNELATFVTESIQGQGNVTKASSKTAKHKGSGEDKESTGKTEAWALKSPFANIVTLNKNEFGKLENEEQRECLKYSIHCHLERAFRAGCLMHLNDKRRVTKDKQNQTSDNDEKKGMPKRYLTQMEQHPVRLFGGFSKLFFEFMVYGFAGDCAGAFRIEEGCHTSRDEMMQEILKEHNERDWTFYKDQVLDQAIDDGMLFPKDKKIGQEGEGSDGLQQAEVCVASAKGGAPDENNDDESEDESCGSYGREHGRPFESTSEEESTTHPGVDDDHRRHFEKMKKELKQELNRVFGGDVAVWSPDGKWITRMMVMAWFHDTKRYTKTIDGGKPKADSGPCDITHDNRKEEKQDDTRKPTRGGDELCGGGEEPGEVSAGIPVVGPVQPANASQESNLNENVGEKPEGGSGALLVADENVGEKQEGGSSALLVADGKSTSTSTQSELNEQHGDRQGGESSSLPVASVEPADALKESELGEKGGDEPEQPLDSTKPSLPECNENYGEEAKERSYGFLYTDTDNGADDYDSYGFLYTDTDDGADDYDSNFDSPQSKFGVDLSSEALEPKGDKEEPTTRGVGRAEIAKETPETSKVKQKKTRTAGKKTPTTITTKATATASLPPAPNPTRGSTQVVHTPPMPKDDDKYASDEDKKVGDEDSVYSSDDVHPVALLAMK